MTSHRIEDWSQDLDLSKILRNNQLPNLDDRVEFQIYFDELPSNNVEASTVSDGNFQSDCSRSIAPTNDEKYLFQRLCEIYSKIQDIATAFTWTGTPFFLEIVPQSVESKLSVRRVRNDVGHLGLQTHGGRNDGNKPLITPAHLSGSMCIADNTEEEWFVVSLLRTLTASIPDISVAVQDNDGDFILVECAIYLPSWLSPQTAVNRVFLRHGSLHIIPRSYGAHAQQTHDHDDISVLSVQKEIQILRADQFGKCMAKPGIQRTIHNRISEFPSIILSWVNNVTTSSDTTKLTTASLCMPYSSQVVVPLPIAMLLRRYPHLLGVALHHLPPCTNSLRDIQRFLKRDIVEKKHVFDCSNPIVPTVLIRVTFNRCQYARLKHLRFQPPARFTPSEWRVPSSTETPAVFYGKSINSNNLETRSAAELGSKLCFGLLCAYVADSRGPDAMVPFFWDVQGIKDGSDLNASDTSQSTVIARIRRFIELLEAGNSTETLSVRSNVPDPWSKLREIVHQSSSNKGQGEAASRLTPRFSTLFDAVSDVIYRDIEDYRFPPICRCCLEKTNDKILEGRMSIGCCGLLCVKPSDSDAWLSVTSESVEELIHTRTRDDRFHQLLLEEYKEIGAGTKTDDKDNDHKSTKSSSTTDPLMWSDTAEQDIPPDIQEMYTEFKNLLNVSSGIEGIDQGLGPVSAVLRGKGHISEQEKERLKKKFPPEFADLLKDLDNELIGDLIDEDNEDEKHTESMHDSWSSGQEDHSTDESDQPDNADYEDKELLTAMYKELSTYMTTRPQQNSQKNWTTSTPRIVELSDEGSFPSIHVGSSYG